MENKLVVVIMGQDCERFIDMSLESVKDADAIVYCDGGSRGRSDMSEDGPMWKFLEENGFYFDGVFGRGNLVGEEKESRICIYNEYDQKDKQMNGKQRNFYLDYVKENYPDWWCLAIDADEVVEDLSKIKEFIQTPKTNITYTWSVKMRHLIQDLGHEDSTVPIHYVPNRLFKISEVDKYPLGEHPVLQSRNRLNDKTDCTTIWHLAYIPNLWEIKKRYDNHLAKSEIHTPEFLKSWYYSHLFGQYPKSQLNPVELPKIILDKFGIDKDELYFANRGLEVKHFIDAIHWKEFFKPLHVIEFGCGKGPRVFALNNIGISTCGYEISKFAVEHSIDQYNVLEGDVLDECSTVNNDLTIAYDLLEHIKYEDLGRAIDNLIESTDRHILISVPTIGDPNLEADPTHIIKESKEWWIKQFTDKGLKLIKTPDHFLFKEQIMIFEK